MAEPRCPHCNKIIDDGQTYCGNCKTKIVWRNGSPSVEVGQKIGRTGCAITSFVWGLGLLIVMVFILYSCFSSPSSNVGTVPKSTTPATSTETTTSTTTQTPTAPTSTPGIRAGTYLIGKDLAPGRYRAAGGITYWERLSGLGGTLGEIIANGAMQAGPVVVDIKSSDVAFKFQGTGRFVLVDDKYESKLATSFGDGMWIVGKDIQPGTYVSESGADYWARLRGFTGQLSDIIANDVMVSGRAIVEIKATDVGFETLGASWKKVQ